MDTVKTTLLLLFMLSAVVMGGLGIYAADAGSSNTDTGGYGIVAQNTALSAQSE